jgi:hypothetical protein
MMKVRLVSRFPRRGDLVVFRSTLPRIASPAVVEDWPEVVGTDPKRKDCSVAIALGVPYPAADGDHVKILLGDGRLDHAVWLANAGDAVIELYDVDP